MNLVLLTQCNCLIICLLAHAVAICPRTMIYLQLLSIDDVAMLSHLVITTSDADSNNSINMSMKFQQLKMNQKICIFHWSLNLNLIMLLPVDQPTRETTNTFCEFLIYLLKMRRPNLVENILARNQILVTGFRSFINIKSK
jgi:hypothetical protein